MAPKKDKGKSVVVPLAPAPKASRDIDPNALGENVLEPVFKELNYSRVFTDTTRSIRTKVTKGSKLYEGIPCCKHDYLNPVVRINVKFADADLEPTGDVLIYKANLYCYTVFGGGDWRNCVDSPFTVKNSKAYGLKSNYKDLGVGKISKLGPGSILDDLYKLRLPSNRPKVTKEWGVAQAGFALHFCESARFKSHQKLINRSMKYADDNNNDFRHKIEYTLEMQHIVTNWSTLSDAIQTFFATHVWTLKPDDERLMNIYSIGQAVKTAAVLLPPSPEKEEDSAGPSKR